MNLDSAAEISGRLGAGRVAAPFGALPQTALRLDNSGPVGEYEVELAVEHLRLDSTSHRDLCERGRGDPQRIAELIAAVVAERGKMHNPETDSGGILLGAVSAVGDGVGSPPAVGDRVASLASLTLIPLRLESVDRVDPDSPQVDVTGTAYLFDRTGWAAMPADIPDDKALELFDVCAAASQVQVLAPGCATICVLGAGHAGKLALAAARDAEPAATLVCVDVDAGQLDAVAGLGLCDIAVATDLRDPLAALEAVREAGAGPADLTVVVVNAAGCEPAAALLTGDRGTVLFFSMATRFSAAALAADGLGCDLRMIVGSGYAPDHGDYALGLVRGSEALREALGIPEAARA
jgi:L-erythro-3,5-diaminohexanoate dehydrogenase